MIINRKYLIILYTLIILCLSQTQKSFGQDSLLIYQQKISKEIQQIRNLTNRQRILENQLTEIDSKIISLQSNDDINWFKRRQLSNLLTEKSRIRQDVINIYDKIITSKNSAYKMHIKYFPLLSANIKSTIKYCETTSDTSQRIIHLEKLLTYIRQRHWLNSIQSYYVPKQAQIPSTNNLPIQLSINKRAKSGFEKELANIITKYIEKLDMMIIAAENEEELRNRLNQFSTEMLALSGESYGNIESEELDNAMKANETGGAGGSYESGVFNEMDGSELTDWTDNRNTDYNNYADNQGRILFGQDLPQENTHPENFIFLFQDIPDGNISSHIMEMDSLRSYYIKLLKNMRK